MTARSSKAEVRNPLLALPSAQRLQSASPEVRALLRDVLRDLSVDAKERAARSWRQNKGPMAAYWKAVSVYAKHLRAALRVAA